MARLPVVTWPLSVVICTALGVASAAVLAQAPSGSARVPLAAGQRIEADDGDVVVVRNDARVTIVHRHDAVVRAIFNPTRHWLILLVDYAAPAAPDGLVDVVYVENGIEGEWPLEERWDGTSVVEDYAVVGEMGPAAVGFTTPRGRVQILTPTTTACRDAHAAAVLSGRGPGRLVGGWMPFDEAEKSHVATAMRNDEMQSRMPAAAGRATGRTVSGAPATGASPAAATGTMFPVRVGGNVATPRKVADAAPVMPDHAREAGVRGVVILEIVVGPDGTVTEARVLRSIPLLDQAAIAAVRQWRYEPTLLDGRAVPVIVIVTVPFN